MAIVSRIEARGADVWMSDCCEVRASMHRVEGARCATASANGRDFGWLCFDNEEGSEFTIFLPPTVAQAMKAAYDAAMAELNSQEDAA